MVLSSSDIQAAIRGRRPGVAFTHLTKGTTPADLLRSIRTGQLAAPSAPDRKMPGTEAAARPTDVLSRREREVLTLLALGHTHRAVARRLEIGVKTVNTYRQRIAEKLGLLNRADIVAFALEAGMLTAESAGRALGTK
jgi:DNA-binding NarL/FixJ family response regulator